MTAMSTEPAMEPANAIAANLAQVKARIEAAAANAPGGPRPVPTLVAVSKTQGVEAVRATLLAGQRVFGENRVQEAAAKWPALRAEFNGIVLHLIGPLQTNKVSQAVVLFDVIETVDREKLARRLAAEMNKSGRHPACYVQVNTGEEPQKAGIPPREADAFIALCRDKIGLDIAGLMCIPPVDEDSAPHFALLAEIARRNGLETLSMGMSDDFEVAVALGATHVRIGTAIFGKRQKPESVT